MPENTSMPFFIKALALTIGGIIALIVSGDIDLDGKIKITLGVILKFASSVGLGLYIGEFVWDYWNLHTSLGYYAQGAAMMAFSIFGMLIVGILYQALQMMQGKTLSEIIKEFKTAVKAILN